MQICSTISTCHSPSSLWCKPCLSRNTLEAFASQMRTPSSASSFAFVDPRMNQSSSLRIPFQNVLLVVNNGKTSVFGEKKILYCFANNSDPYDCMCELTCTSQIRTAQQKNDLIMVRSHQTNAKSKWHRLSLEWLCNPFKRKWNRFHLVWTVLYNLRVFHSSDVVFAFCFRLVWTKHYSG